MSDLSVNYWTFILIGFWATVISFTIEWFDGQRRPKYWVKYVNTLIIALIIIAFVQDLSWFWWCYWGIGLLTAFLYLLLGNPNQRSFSWCVFLSVGWGPLLLKNIIKNTVARRHKVV